MRVFVLLCVLLLGANVVFAQSGIARVTLKDGTVITGEVKQIDPAKSVTIVVAGIESEISMSDVASIDPVEETAQAATQAASFEDEWTYEDFNKALPSDNWGEYVILDKAEYPDSFKIEVGGQTFTMLLVRGGVFNMGYDGHLSMSFFSEPVHKVKLSSFYISREILEESVANDILANNDKSKPGGKFKTNDWDEVKTIIDKVAEEKGLPYRLVTEAEWEYAAISSYAESVFREVDATYGKYGRREWCSDYYDEFKSTPQTNPTGPTTGKRHVGRIYYKDDTFSMTHNANSKYMRYPTRNPSARVWYMRFAISADKVKFD